MFLGGVAGSQIPPLFLFGNGICGIAISRVVLPKKESTCNEWYPFFFSVPLVRFEANRCVQHWPSSLHLLVNRSICSGLEIGRSPSCCADASTVGHTISWCALSLSSISVTMECHKNDGRIVLNHVAHQKSFDPAMNKCLERMILIKWQGGQNRSVAVVGLTQDPSKSSSWNYRQHYLATNDLTTSSNQCRKDLQSH